MMVVVVMIMTMVVNGGEGRDTDNFRGLFNRW